MNSETKNDAALQLHEKIRGIPFAMLTTCDQNGELRSRPMATVECDSNDLWFFTRDNTAKVSEVNQNQHVNLSFVDSDRDVFVSVTGLASVVNDRSKIRELWRSSFKAWYPEGEADPHLTLLRVRVVGAEYWDSHSRGMRQLLEIAKSLLSDEELRRPRPEHGTISVEEPRPL